jgi:hypothetical protein
MNLNKEEQSELESAQEYMERCEIKFTNTYRTYIRQGKEYNNAVKNFQMIMGGK